MDPGRPPCDNSSHLFPGSAWARAGLDLTRAPARLYLFPGSAWTCDNRSHLFPGSVWARAGLDVTTARGTPLPTPGVGMHLSVVFCKTRSPRIPNSQIPKFPNSQIQDWARDPLLEGPILDLGIWEFGNLGIWELAPPTPSPKRRRETEGLRRPQIPKFPNSQIPQIPKFPNSQIPKFPNPGLGPRAPPWGRGGANSQIPKFPNSQIPKFPNSQIQDWALGVMGWEGGGQFPNSQIPKFPNPGIWEFGNLGIWDLGSSETSIPRFGVGPGRPGCDNSTGHASTYSRGWHGPFCGILQNAIPPYPKFPNSQIPKFPNPGLGPRPPPRRPNPGFGNLGIWEFGNLGIGPPPHPIAQAPKGDRGSFDDPKFPNSQIPKFLGIGPPHPITSGKSWHLAIWEFENLVMCEFARICGSVAAIAHPPRGPNSLPCKGDRGSWVTPNRSIPKSREIPRFLDLGIRKFGAFADVAAPLPRHNPEGPILDLRNLRTLIGTTCRMSWECGELGA